MELLLFITNLMQVVDVAKGHVAALKRFKSSDCEPVEVYNLGTGYGYSVKDMVASFEKTSGRKVSSVEHQTDEDIYSTGINTDWGAS